jgi:hypothetical protein
MDKAKTKLPVLAPGEIIQAFQELRDIRKKGLRSGLGNIDDMIGGIWRDGVVISGDPGHGKTVFSLNLSVGFGASGNRIIYLDLENDRRDIISLVTSIMLFRFMGERAPSLADMVNDPHLISQPDYWEKIELHLRPFFSLIDVTNLKVRLEMLREWMKIAAKELKEHPGKQAILFIDSINELATVFPLANSLYESLERWLAGIKLLRIQYQIPIALICHVPKDSTKEIFNPKGSSGIAHFARTQMIIKRMKENERMVVEASVVRAQFGKTGRRRFVLDEERLGLTQIVEWEEEII